METYQAAFRHFVEMEQAHAMSDWDAYAEHRAALLDMRRARGADAIADPADVFAEANSPGNSSGWQLTPAQVRVRDFLSPDTPYRSLLLVHGVGMGKTCTAVSVIERSRDVYRPASPQESAQRQHLVLVPASLKPSFYRQVLDVDRLQFDANGRLASDEVPPQCVGDKYLRMIPDRHSLDRATLQTRVNAVVDRFYLINSYIEFALELDRVQERIDRAETDPVRRAVRMHMHLKQTYSDRVIVIDEVHNLRSDAENSLVPPRIKQLVEAVENVKLLLMSATPMFDRANEIIFIVNLMLENEKLPTLDESDVFSADGTMRDERKLADALYGRVSFVHGKDPREFPAELYPTRDAQAMRAEDAPTLDVHGKDIAPEARLDTAGMPMVVSTLNGASALAYERFVANVDESDDVTETSVQNYLQVSSVTFPDTNAVGNQAFADCFRTSTTRGTSQFTYTTHFPFLAQPHVYTYAPKIATIVDRVVSSRGLVVVYSNYIRTGILPLAIALEHRGFLRVDGRALLARSAIHKAAPDGKSFYVVLSGEKATTSSDADIELARSLANADGSRVKVILMSRRGSEGWDLKNVREMHILEPWYNMSRMEQIKGRAVRRSSHAALDARQRNVTVYLHVAVHPDAAGKESFDQRAYRIARTKRVGIDRVTDVLRRASIERALRLDANVQTLRAVHETAQGETVHVRTSYVVEHHVGLRDIRNNRTYQVQHVMDRLASAFPSPDVFQSVDEVADVLGMDPSAVAYCLMYIALYHPSKLVRSRNSFAMPATVPHARNSQPMSRSVVADEA